MSNSPPHIIEDEEAEEAEEGKGYRALASSHIDGNNTAQPRSRELDALQLTQWQAILLSIGNCGTPGTNIAFWVAFSNAPHLIWMESDPFRYLARFGGDIRCTAATLMAYWNCRVDLFGHIRALKPLTMDVICNESALTDEELCLIETGYMCPLPCDASGRTVLCSDMSRRSMSAYGNNPAVRLRAAFYFWHVVAENPLSQTQGAYFLHICRCPFFSNIDAVTVKTLQLIQHFPILIFENHFFDCRPSVGPKSKIEDLMQCLSLYFLRHQSYIHCKTDDPMTWIYEMEALCFNRNGLPECISGTYDVDVGLNEWINARTISEWERYADFGPCGTTDDDDSSMCISESDHHGESSVDDDDEDDERSTATSTTVSTAMTASSTNLGRSSPSPLSSSLPPPRPCSNTVTNKFIPLKQRHTSMDIAATNTTIVSKIVSTPATAAAADDSNMASEKEGCAGHVARMVRQQLQLQTERRHLLGEQKRLESLVEGASLLSHYEDMKADDVSV